MLTHVDLFSGIGGFALAAEWAGFKTIVFCEKDDYCQKVLKKRFPGVPIVSEIRNFRWPLADNGISQPMELSRGKQTRRDRIGNGGQVTLLTGGFPCQPFSVAGKQRGKEDDRYLWPEMFAVISEVRPTWVIAENVAGIVPMELDRCLFDLEGEDYETQAFIIPACAVEAKHRRDRVWIVGYSPSDRRKDRYETPRRKKREGEQGGMRQSEGTSNVADDDRRCGPFYENEKIRTRGNSSDAGSQDVADSKFSTERAPFRKRSNKGRSDGQQKNRDILGDDIGNGSKAQPRQNVSNSPGRRCAQRESKREEKGNACQEGGENGIFWPVEPDVGRVAYGIPSRVDRLKSLGNAIVPPVAYEIIRAIKTIEEERQSLNKKTGDKK